MTTSITGTGSQTAGGASFGQRLLRVAELMTTPLLPSDYLDFVSPLRSGTELRGRVVEVRPETRDAVTLVLEPGRDWRGHTPGQYVRVGVEVDGVRHWRTYSLTSRPNSRSRRISITVKAIDEGLVSNYLVRHARAGMLLRLDQAAGEFVLPQAAPAKVLFVTGGSGITPVMGMLRSGALDASDVVLVHSAPTSADVIFAGELRRLAAIGSLTLIELHTDVHGMLAVGDLESLVPDYTERETWACGPSGLLDALEEHFNATGRPEKLHVERFRPTIISVGEGGTVTFTRGDVTVEADGATPLLDAGEAAGVLMPSGCRMGVCFGCVVPLRDGAVRDLRSGDITTASEGDGVLIQTCISAAAGPCHIDV